MPLWRTISSILLVMLMKSIRAGTWKVRYSVCDFMTRDPDESATVRPGSRKWFQDTGNALITCCATTI
jgi:hypothetical protein